LAVVRLTGLLAQEVGARRFTVEAATLGDALHGLPATGLVLDEHGDLRPLVHAYVDGSRELDLGTQLAPGTEVILIAAIAGG
jgi:molybdopterin converting factor small subunit